MTLKIIPIPALKDNYIWLIINTDNHCAMVVDPGEAAPVLQALKQYELSLSAILITHHHWDHVNGVEGILKEFTVPVYGGKHENVPHISHPLVENDHVKLPEFHLDFKVLEIPGHTLGHIAYYSEGIVFTGDTLFTGGCGRLFEGTPDQMVHSLEKLMALPDNTKIYCGHEYTQSNLHFAKAVEPKNHPLLKRINHVAELRLESLPTVPAFLSEEKLTNPFLRYSIPAVIEAAEKHVQKKLETPIEVFACLRDWKNNFKG